MSGSSAVTVTVGALWTVAMRWADRLISFVSTLILARLLLPADFGIIAMAAVVVGLVDVLLDFGVTIALIQNREPSASHYNSAWTLRLLQSAVGAAAVAVLAPVAADFFNEPRLVAVLWFMAVAMLLSGFENIGIVTFQKDMLFAKDFQFTFTKRLLSFFVTIIAALILHNYWAFVIGSLAQRLFAIGLSYWMHPMRPRLSFQQMRAILSVSQWMLLNSVGVYANVNAHKAIVGRSQAAEALGGYTLADEIAAMPTTELLAPINRVLFPAFVRARHDEHGLHRLFLLAQGVQSLVAIPASIGLALVANEAVLVLLGAKWLFAVPFIQILCIANVLQAITTSGSYLMLTTGHVRSLVLISWTQFALFAAAVALCGAESAVVIAMLRVASVLAGLIICIFLLLRHVRSLSAADLARNVARPVVAAICMGFCLTIIDDTGLVLSPIAMLGAKVSLGALIYTCAIVLLWGLAGWRNGAEAYLLEKLRRNLAAWRGARSNS